MSNFFNYSSFPGIRPRSGADTADMSRSGAVRRIAADVVVAAGVLAFKKLGRDEDPPFTVRYLDDGDGAGWEARVADPRGRAFNMLLEYRFN